MQISVKTDIKKAMKSLNNIQRKQIPFAASQAINSTAFDAMREAKAEIPKRIDRPTRFTASGVQVKRSNKTNLTAIVFIPPNRWKYMTYAVEGGTAPKGNVPVNAKLNSYGSMGRGYLRRMLARKNTFSGTVKGTPGVWERLPGGRLKLIAKFETSLNYQKRYPFGQIVETKVRQVFPRHMNQALRRALASAR